MIPVLHAPTLYFVVVMASTMAGLHLLWIWAINRNMVPLAWWGLSFLAGAFGTVLFSLRGAAPAALSITMANAIMIQAYALSWMSARSLGDKRVLTPLTFAGAILWLVACQVPAFYESVAARVILSSALSGTSIFAMAWEFMRIGQPLPSRRAAALISFIHASFIFARVPMLLFSGYDATLPFTYSFTVILIEAFFFTLSSSFILLNLMREKTELGHLRASLIDPLTGISNRRGFFRSAEALLEGGPQPSHGALILLDLDRFKQINDRFGHSLGDQVLRLFTAVAEGQIRPGHLLGRIGGEEFAVLMPGGSLAEAERMAQRIITTFATLGEMVDGTNVHATVSAGVAISGAESGRLADLMVAADRALYRAKDLGRNRLERAVERSAAA